MELYRKEEYYKIVGICMEVHRILGGGLLEIVYKDALEYEFRKHGILFEREVKYQVKYKNIILPHQFFADFVVFGSIILEVKTVSDLIDQHFEQTINYLAVSGNEVGLLVNFRKPKLQYKRIILTEV